MGETFVKQDAKERSWNLHPLLFSFLGALVGDIILIVVYGVSIALLILPQLSNVSKLSLFGVIAIPAIVGFFMLWGLIYAVLYVINQVGKR